MSRAVLRIRVLGPLECDVDGVPADLGGPRQRAVLAMLLCARGGVLSVDRLADGLWGDELPPTATMSLRTYIARLRKLLEPDRPRRTASAVLVGAAPGYALRVDDDAVDAWRFERLVDEARALADGRAAEARSRARTALDLWRGPPYAEMADQPWAVTECVRLEELRLATTELWLALTLRLGMAADAVPTAESLTREQPLREEAWRLLALALWAGGRQADALAALDRCREALAAEVGLAPGPALAELEAAILAQRVEVLADLTRGARRVAQADSPVPHQLPAPPPAFVGRSAELAALDAALAAIAHGPATVVISALAGTAGVGKTALATHWAHRVADRFPDGQLYVNLRGFDPAGEPVPPADAVAGFLTTLGVSAERMPAAVDDRAALYRSLLNGRQMLVVLDNARDEEQVRPLLPGWPGCLVVVTSRSRLSGLAAAEEARPLGLDLLNEAESRELLARRLGAARVDAEPEAVAGIVDRCVRLPLALAIVSARAAIEPDRPLAALGAELRATQRRLDPFSGTDAATDLRAVFSWSYDALRPPAARLFRLLGAHVGPDLAIPAAASLAGIPVPDAGALLAELAAAHLVAEVSPGRYGQHDLLAAYAAELSSRAEGERTVARRRLVDHYVHSGHIADRLMNPLRVVVTLPPPVPGMTPAPLADERAATAWFTAEHPALLRAVALADEYGWDEPVWLLAWAMADHLDRTGRWSDWALTQTVAGRAASRAGDLRWELFALRDTARAYARLDRPDEAMPRLYEALALVERIGDPAEAAHTRLAMSAVLGRIERYAEAADQAREALALYREVGAVRGEASALNTVGWHESLLGEHERALPSCHEALRLHESLDDLDGQAATWDSLGHIHQRLGRYAQAGHCFRRSLAIVRQLGDRYYEAHELANLAANHHRSGEPEAARRLWEQALALFDRLGHPEADDVRKALEQV